MKELGVEDSGINRMIKSVYHLLNLRTFITAGEKKFTPGQFLQVQKPLKQQVLFIQILKKVLSERKLPLTMNSFLAGSYNACKEKGVTRLEGKDYVVQDGDLVHFRFNV